MAAGLKCGTFEVTDAADYWQIEHNYGMPVIVDVRVRINGVLEKAMPMMLEHSSDFNATYISFSEPRIGSARVVGFEQPITLPPEGPGDVFIFPIEDDFSGSGPLNATLPAISGSIAWAVFSSGAAEEGLDSRSGSGWLGRNAIGYPEDNVDGSTTGASMEFGLSTDGTISPTNMVFMETEVSKATLVYFFLNDGVIGGAYFPSTGTPATTQIPPLRQGVFIGTAFTEIAAGSGDYDERITLRFEVESNIQRVFVDGQLVAFATNNHSGSYADTIAIYTLSKVGSNFRPALHPISTHVLVNAAVPTPGIIITSEDYDILDAGDNVQVVNNRSAYFAGTGMATLDINLSAPPNTVVADASFTIVSTHPDATLYFGIGGTDNDFYGPIDLNSPSMPGRVGYEATTVGGSGVGIGTDPQQSIPVNNGDVVRVSMVSNAGAVDIFVNEERVAQGGPVTLDPLRFYVGASF